MTACCGRYLAGTAVPASAELLMRSRYTAFKQLNEAYLLATWHPATRPQQLQLLKETPRPQWTGLTVLSQQLQDATHATVEFVARHKINGRAYRLHETSRFVQDAGCWFYVDGDIH